MKHLSFVIGLSPTEANQLNYLRWLTRAHTRLILLDHSSQLNQCHLLVLSGGVDIHPKFYKGPSFYPNMPVFDEARDAFEQQLYKKAVLLRMPVLGICRGLQLINVLNGGKLTQDLGQLNFFHQKTESGDSMHQVRTVEGTLFASLLGRQLTVNSNHHQALSQLGAGLKVNCLGEDGVIQGVQGQQMSRQWLLGVQWHPQRHTSSSSERIFEQMAKAALAFKSQTQKQSDTHDLQ